MAWGAAWLYRATNNVTYLNDAKAFYTQFSLSNNPSEFSWDSKTAGVQVLYPSFFLSSRIDVPQYCRLMQVMMAKLTNDTLYKTAVKAFCDSKVNQPKTPRGFCSSAHGDRCVMPQILPTFVCKYRKKE